MCPLRVKVCQVLGNDLAILVNLMNSGNSAIVIIDVLKSKGIATDPENQFSTDTDTDGIRSFSPNSKLARQRQIRCTVTRIMARLIPSDFDLSAATPAPHARH